MLTQVPLDFQFHGQQCFNNYHDGPNAQTVESLRSCATGKGMDYVYLWGETGLGKSHLLNACCRIADQHKFSTACIPLKNLNQLHPAMFEGLETLDLVCLDDIESIAGQASWEQPIFHFFNRLRENQNRLIVSASKPPTQIAIRLADLKSRLCWGLTTKLRSFSDQDKLAALALRANSLGFDLPAKVAQYLLAHYPRDLSYLWLLLQQLDHGSLSAKHRLTIPFVKKLLGSPDLLNSE